MTLVGGRSVGVANYRLLRRALMTAAVSEMASKVTLYCALQTIHPGISNCTYRLPKTPLLSIVFVYFIERLGLFFN